MNISHYVHKEENRNIQVCLSGFSMEEKELAIRLVKKMRENIENDLERNKKSLGVIIL